jgi:hypothetical protein
MSHPADHLYELLPVVIRTADAKQEYPLRDLLRVIGEEATLLEDEIRQMYDNLFIETCEPWVVPYIGDLVGYEPLFVPPGTGDGCEEDGRASFINPRRSVAERVGLARRKGTFSVLDDLITSATGWPAHVVDDEGEDLVAHVHVWRLPSWPLTRVRPFYQPRHTNSYSLSVLGNDAPLFTRGDPEPDEEITAGRQAPQRLLIDDLKEHPDAYYGQDKSLCLYENEHAISASRLQPMDLSDWKAEIVDDEIAVDPELGRVMFPERYRPKRFTASYHYGFATAMGGGEYPRPLQNATLGISLFREGHLVDQGIPFLEEFRVDLRPIAEWLRERMANDVLTMDLDDGAKVERLLAPELNRLMQAFPLPEGLLPPNLELDEEGVMLRSIDPQGNRRIRLTHLQLEALYPDTINRSFGIVRIDSTMDSPTIMDVVREMEADDRTPLTMVIELTDSGFYVESIVMNARPFHTLILRAAEGCRPTILLSERSADIDDMVISAGHASRIVLDGLMIANRGVRITGNPLTVDIRHCTLVPGWELGGDCEPRRGEEPSLILSDIPLYQPWEREGWSDCPPELLISTHVRIDRTITGTILIQRDEVDAEPVRLDICRSIVDATDEDAVAIGAPGDRKALAILGIVSSTIIGTVNTHAIELGENSIFMCKLEVGRRQVGCMRFCYVPRGSRTPARHACQPDLVIAAVKAKELPPWQEQNEIDDESNRVTPVFIDPDLRYGRPDYCRLDDISDPGCASEIRQGADDESEMGVFRDLYVPQRLSNLRSVVREFMPIGWNSEVRFES